jgi:hypothetical protein
MEWWWGLPFVGLGVILGILGDTIYNLTVQWRETNKLDKKQSEDRERKYVVSQITREVLANIEQNKAQHKAEEVK